MAKLALADQKELAPSIAAEASWLWGRPATFWACSLNMALGGKSCMHGSKRAQGAGMFYRLPLATCQPETLPFPPAPPSPAFSSGILPELLAPRNHGENTPVEQRLSQTLAELEEPAPPPWSHDSPVAQAFTGEPNSLRPRARPHPAGDSFSGAPFRGKTLAAR